MTYRSNWLRLPQDADDAQIKAVRDYAATLPEGQPVFVEIGGGEVWNEYLNIGNERWCKPQAPRVIQSPAERARRHFANRKTRV